MTESAPPPKLLYAYRLLGLRLPDEYAAWVAKDVNSQEYLNWRIARRFLWTMALVAVYAVGQRAFHRWPAVPTMARLTALTLAYALLGSGKRLARRELRWQQVDKRGNRATPRGLGLLSQAEAVLAAVLVVIATGGGGALAGYALSPRLAKCVEPSDETKSAIADRITRPGAKLTATASVQLVTGEYVLGLMEAPKAGAGDEKDRQIEMWAVTENGVFSLPRNEKVSPSWTDFPKIQSVDRALNVETYTILNRCFSDAVRS